MCESAVGVKTPRNHFAISGKLDLGILRAASDGSPAGKYGPLGIATAAVMVALCSFSDVKRSQGICAESSGAKTQTSAPMYREIFFKAGNPPEESDCMQFHLSANHRCA